MIFSTATKDEEIAQKLDEPTKFRKKLQEDESKQFFTNRFHRFSGQKK